MVRDTMLALIARVRLMVADTGSAPVFTDDQVQEALDRHRHDARRMVLESVPTVQPGGGILVPQSYVDHYAVDGIGDWEDDLLFQDITYQTVAPSASENLVGHWAFAGGMRPPVSLTGKHYDCFLAAADLLDAWAAAYARDFDFESDNQRFRRSQAAKMMRDQAKEYRTRGRPAYAQLVRDDVDPRSS